MDIRQHRNLDVWKKSMDFVKTIYKVTEGFPQSEAFGITSQMRRAAISIPSNLAEGAARKGNKEFEQFLNIAQGSISELDTQTELAVMLNYINEKQHEQLMREISSISAYRGR